MPQARFLGHSCVVLTHGKHRLIIDQRDVGQMQIAMAFADVAATPAGAQQRFQSHERTIEPASQCVQLHAQRGCRGVIEGHEVVDGPGVNACRIARGHTRITRR